MKDAKDVNVMKKLLFVAILLLSLVGMTGQAAADTGATSPTPLPMDSAGITWE